ncbi:hypothetical protein M758_12G031700, partial [Ceratodon purpureus]
TGFATGRISLGEVEVMQISAFKPVWTALEGGIDNKGITFYCPDEIPIGYNILCHSCQGNSGARIGWILAIKETGSRLLPQSSSVASSPSLPSSPTLLRGAQAQAHLNFPRPQDNPPDDERGNQEVVLSRGAQSFADSKACNFSTQSTNRVPASTLDAKVEELIAYYQETHRSVSDAMSNVNPERNCNSPALKCPVDFELIWTSSTWVGKQNGNAWVWLPIAPKGYSALGYLVTNTEDKPRLTEVTCVRTNLTDALELDSKLFSTSGDLEEIVTFCSTRPAERGANARGVSVGSFFCGRSNAVQRNLPIACLKNIEFTLDAMPTMEQVCKIQRCSGPTMVFHPEEQYLPSSVAWFFDSGAMLYSKDSPPLRIKTDGSNLPQCDTNDSMFWIDLPGDGTQDTVKKGNLKTAKVYIHVKPVNGGTYTDLQSWIFYPFRGPSIARVGKVDIPLGLGEHLADWKHYTLRVSNFTGGMEAVYFSHQSKGEWVEISDLEFYAANKYFMYIAKNVHSCYPHEGNHIQGDENHGIGLQNDTTVSSKLLVSSENFEIFSAEFMHERGDIDAPLEPDWLHHMREWGPKIENDENKFDEALKILPSNIRNSLQSFFEEFPAGVLHQEGRTGPREKCIWLGDEEHERA